MIHFIESYLINTAVLCVLFFQNNETPFACVRIRMHLFRKQRRKAKIYLIISFENKYGKTITICQTQYS
jgi:hypothetical protein